MSWRGTTVVVVATVAASLLNACGGDSAGIASHATTPVVSRTGPALIASAASLSKSTTCYGDPARNPKPTVLLVHGTAETADAEWTWNYIPALTALGRAVCTVDLPDAGMGDIQESAEYVVAAIRSIHAKSGQKIQIIGHSQGGMIPRWALKYWPDTRAMVDDLVGLASSNHGTLDAVATCMQPCAASFWQQATGSQFITALNAGGETFAGIDYSTIYTHYDQVVIPNADAGNGSSALRPAALNVVNVATQDLCPSNTGEHLALGSYDPVAWALALDAISHAGAVQPSNVALTVCAQTTMPGVDQSSYAADYAALGRVVAANVQNYPRRSSEPTLKCYVTQTC